MAVSALVFRYDLDCVNPVEEICYKVSVCPKELHLNPYLLARCLLCDRYAEDWI
jgi:hypothetical protein